MSISSIISNTNV